LDYLSAKTEILNLDPKLKVVFEEYLPSKNDESNSSFVRLIRIIVGQQLSGAAAKTIFTRLTNLIGEDFNETDLLSLDDSQFSAIGISQAKKNYSKMISLFLVTSPDYFNDLERLTPDERISELMKFKGVGVWTASIFVMSSDLMSDIFAYGDGTLTKVIKKIYNLSDEQLASQLELIVSNWSPYKTLVCNALWHYNDNVLTQTQSRI
jgi:DNA-3-methyladenine glycosylase II